VVALFPPVLAFFPESSFIVIRQKSGIPRMDSKEVSATTAERIRELRMGLSALSFRRETGMSEPVLDLTMNQLSKSLLQKRMQ